MSPWHAFSLGILQGLTEFLPVSSSGHLVLAQKLFGFSEPPVLFDVLLHLGSLAAVIVFFIKDFLKLQVKTLSLVIIGTIPAVIAGLFLNQYIEQIFNSLKMLGYSFLITAALLFSVKFIKNKKEKDLNQISWLDSLGIGFMQAVAILPGVSRSGSTVVAGLWRGLKRETAFLFSFYLAVPAILGASVLKIKDTLEVGSVNLGFNIVIIGLITSFISALVSIKLLKKVILQGQLSYFGIYCLALGLMLFLYH